MKVEVPSFCGLLVGWLDGRGSVGQVGKETEMKVETTNKRSRPNSLKVG